MNKYISTFLVSTLVLLASCGSKHQDAENKLTLARQLYNAGNYEQAKAEIDSISTVYPKALEVRKASKLLLDSVRLSSEVVRLEQSKAGLELLKPSIDSMKKLFVLDKNEKYQDTGNYLPKETSSKGLIGMTLLRSGVSETGQLYLESVFIGGQKHDRISATVAGGEVLESLPVTDDGLNYSFSNLGKTFEVIRFSGENENGLVKFIADNADKKITIHLIGKGKYAFVMTPQFKEAVGKSYRLSKVMLQADSLSSVIEDAEIHIKYLDNKEEIRAIKRDLRANGGQMKDVH